MITLFHNVFLLLLFFLALTTTVRAQRAEKVFQQARDEHKTVLLIFSGSDWCIPCRAFREKVLDTPEFQEFADEELVLLEADFPQRTKLPKEVEAENEALAERYNPSGQFPYYLLLDPSGEKRAILSHQNQNTGDFIHQVQQYLPETGRELVFTHQAGLMGSVFEFQIAGPSSRKEEIWKWLKKGEVEVRRIEALISSWAPDSQTSLININAGVRPVAVDAELYELIQRSKQVSTLTQGAFDISFAAMDRHWTFDGSEARLPDPDQLASQLQLVGYDQIRLDPEGGTVFLPQAGMKIGFGGIGKGYAADQVRKMWVEAGFENGLVNAGGDLLAWGNRPDGTPWKVGIASPDQTDRVLAWLPCRDQSIATSGDYERYLMIEGQRYGHIIDPRTGYPARGIKSVTVVAPTGELADALASAVFVLGIEVGLDLIDQLPATEALIIDEMNHLHLSTNLDLQVPKPIQHE